MLGITPLKEGRACRMGTHPSGPSLVVGGEGLTLKDWISQHLSVLGDARHVFGPDLPFLFKACQCPLFPRFEKVCLLGPNVNCSVAGEQFEDGSGAVLGCRSGQRG